MKKEARGCASAYILKKALNLHGFLRIIRVKEEGSDDLNDKLESKKRNRKVLITDKAIKKVPRIRYKEIPEDEYDNIWDLAKQVLEISQKENDSNEVAITYSLENKKLIEQDEEYIGIALGDVLLLCFLCLRFSLGSLCGFCALCGFRLEIGRAHV